jgi:hypothetical protein
VPGTFRSIAYAAGAEADYRFFYAGVSRYSHPTLSNASAYLSMDEAGRFSARSDAPNPPLLGPAGVFAVEYLVRVIRRVSPTLGNDPVGDSALEDLVAEYHARMSVRPIPDLQPRKPL